MPSLIFLTIVALLLVDAYSPFVLKSQEIQIAGVGHRSISGSVFLCFDFDQIYVPNLIKWKFSNIGFGNTRANMEWEKY